MSPDAGGTPGLNELKGDGRPTLALLTNILAPYRIPIYNELGRRFSLHVLYSGNEDNRQEWKGSETELQGVHVKRSAGFTIKYFAPRSGTAADQRYLHINPGYLLDLVRLKPQAVLSIELGFRTLCASLYCAIARVPLLVWWEGSIDTERDIGVVRRLLRRVLAKAARRWISGGVKAGEYLLSLGVPASKIVHAQNCVDEKKFVHSEAPPKTLGRRPVVLVVSRLVPGKGIGLLLDAVSRLRSAGTGCTVVIVGDGPDREALQARAGALGLSDVAFHLSRPPSEMPSYYRGADVLVLPTLHDVWGLVVNEAMWSGLPVLASRFAGCAEELLPADQIFDPTNPADLDAKLRRALVDGLPRVNTARLRPLQQVAATIGDSVAGLLARTIGDPTG